MIGASLAAGGSTRNASAGGSFDREDVRRPQSTQSESQDVSCFLVSR